MSLIESNSNIKIIENDINDNQEKIIDNWDELNIKDDILRGIFRYGFEKPTPIQSLAIPPITCFKDTIAQAKSGSGKTGSFIIATLQNLDISNHCTQALIIAPTRELVKQIYTVAINLSNLMESIKIKTLVGGSSVNEDSNYLKHNNPHLIVGTIGRIYDMVRRKNIDTYTIKLLILDEADEMLSKGFKNQIYDLFQFLPESMQVALFSATFSKEIINLTEKFMKNPIKIMLKPEELTLECIQQYYIALRDDSDKYDTLKDLFSLLEVQQSIIYVNTIKRVNDLYNAMIDENFPVCFIHSNMEKSQREEALSKFRNGNFRVLISSGITARGIDIQQVSTVINFDITKDVHTYLHAIGRSGRYGRKGLAINFVTKYDIDIMKKIEKHYNINIPELPANFKNLI